MHFKNMYVILKQPAPEQCLKKLEKNIKTKNCYVTIFTNAQL